MNNTRKNIPFVIIFSFLMLSLIGLMIACICVSTGENAKSAYQIWLEEGHTGSREDFLEWLKGEDGEVGSDGKSAYDIWLEAGYIGSQADFLKWLKGKDGVGEAGSDGKSAYDIWLEAGHTGSQEDFLNWIKGEKGNSGTDGTNGSDGSDGTDGKDGLSAYEIYVKYNPDYTGTEEQWINALVNNQLIKYTVTFKSEVWEADVVKTAFYGLPLTDVPAVPEKEGQTSAEWSVKDFSSITQNMEVIAIYDMRKYVTFHNEFTNDEDITITVNFGEDIADIPQVTPKVGNDGMWSVKNFRYITSDMYVEAIYSTQGLQYVLNEGTHYVVSKGRLSADTQELFILSEYQGKPVKAIDEGAFRYCSFIYAYIPDSVTSIGSGAFMFCRSLTNVTISNNIESIKINAFSDCSNLTSIAIPAAVTEIGVNAFLNCNLDSITVAPDNSKYHSADNCIIETSSKTLIVGCKTSIIPTDDSVTIIGAYAFSSGRELVNITIPSNIQIIKNYAFSGCDKLTSFVIPNSVREVGDYVFHYCRSLNSVVIGSNVSIIGHNVFSSTNLENITVSADNKKYHSNGNCLIETATKTLVSGCNTSVIPTDGSVMRIGAYAFAYDDDIANITIPDSVTSIGDYAFAYINSITNITIPDSVTNIGCGAFEHCIELTSITGGDNITDIGERAFEHCINLTDITIPQGVASISERVFWGCSNLTSIVIPAGITSIENGAFGGCDKLEKIYFKGSAAQFAQISVDATDNNSFFVAKAYYYSETAPVGNGNYWHYADDGVTPVVWVKEN